MSSHAQGHSSWRRWRAPVVGAVAGLAVAAGIVGQAALADSGGNTAAPAKVKAGVPAPGGVPHQFTDAVAQLVQAGTITAAQGRALDTQIESGSMDPQAMVREGVVSAAQMQAVNARLIAVKESLGAQMHPDAASAKSAALSGKAAAAPQVNCAVAPAVRGKAAR